MFLVEQTKFDTYFKGQTSLFVTLLEGCIKFPFMNFMILEKVTVIFIGLSDTKEESFPERSRAWN